MPYISAPTAATGNGDGSEVCVDPGHWSATHEPAAATQATCTKAATANVRHVCKVISVSIACGATAQTPISVRLRDGATGAGTILWSMKVSAPVNSSQVIYEPGLSIVGSVNTAMTLEFSAAGVAASEQTVNLSGFDLSGQ